MAVKKAAPAKKATATKKAVASSRAKAANGASTAGQGGAKKAAAKKTPAAAKTAAKTAASGSTTSTTPTRAAAKKTTAARTPASTAKRTTAGRAKKASAPASALAVRAEEEPWTPAELDAVRAELEDDVSRLRAEISAAEIDLVGLMRDAGDGSGDDQADAGAKTYEREQEISVANNTREMLDQSEHALERIADGSYGICESCGNPIGKLRLQAFPRATLCVTCKQKQERR